MPFYLHLQMFLRSFFLQAGWNFAKYQNLGLAFVMLPFLRRLYIKDTEALPSVLQRYLESFNTQPTMASFCFGALAWQEERMAHTKTLPAYQERLSEWNTIKRSLSITTASIGDRLFWGTLKPFTLLLALCMWLFLDVNFFEADMPTSLPGWSIWGVCLSAFAVFNVITLFVKWQGIKLSCLFAGDGRFGLTKFDWNKTIYNAKRLGLLLAALLLLGGVYYFIHGFDEVWGFQFFTRAILVLFFVSISLLTHNLRIPNMYLYIAAMISFSVVCLI